MGFCCKLFRHQFHQQFVFFVVVVVVVVVVFPLSLIHLLFV